MNALLPFDGYIRVSKIAGRSGDSFISPAVQRETIERLAAFHGIDVGEVVEELDVSGGKAIDDRELGRLVRKVEAGESGGLLVWKVSRFSRSLLDGVTVAERVCTAGGRILGDDLDSGAPMGRAILGFLLGWAEEELDARRAGWRDAQRRAAARGAYPSRTPLGYLKDEDGRLVINPETADVVTKVFRMRADGASLGECGKLIGAGASSVRALLSNPAYLGRIEHGDGDGAIYVEGTHPALIDARTWQLAQRGDGPARRTGSLAGKGLLLGIIRCAGCGNVLTTVAGGPPERRMASYTCRKVRAGSVCPAPASARVDAVDALVRPAIAEHDAEASRGFEVYMRAVQESARAFEDAAQEFDAFLEGASIAALGADAYNRQVARLREDVEAKRAAWAADAERGRGLLGLGETSGLEHERAVARTLIESATLRKSARGRWDNLEERLEVVWR